MTVPLAQTGSPKKCRRRASKRLLGATSGFRNIKSRSLPRKQRPMLVVNHTPRGYVVAPEDSSTRVSAQKQQVPLRPGGQQSFMTDP